MQTVYGLVEKPIEGIDEVVTRLRWYPALNTLEEMGEKLKPLLCGKEQQCGDKELSSWLNGLLSEVKAFVEEVGRLDALREAWGREDKERKKELHIQIQKIYNKAREHLAPALLLLELNAAVEKNSKKEMERALWRFALVFSAAVAGDGSVSRYQISLSSGEGGPALLWLAALYKAAEVQARLTQRAAEAAKEGREVELVFTPRLRQLGAAYRIEVTGKEGLVNLAALMPAIGINLKAEEAVMVFREKSAETRALEAEVKNLRRAEAGAAVDLVIKAGGLEARYWTYLGKKIVLNLFSTNPEEVEKAAHLLRLTGVRAEVGKTYRKQKKYEWYLNVSTDRLADRDVDARLREKPAEAVEKAAEAGLVKRETAEGWAEKLGEGVTVAGDMPKFTIRVTDRGSLNINYRPSSAEQLSSHVEALMRIGLVEGLHFTVKEPKDSKLGRLAITMEGVVKLGELSIHAEDKSTRIEAARWVDRLLKRAGESGGEEAYRRVEELVKEGKARGAYTLTGLRREVEVDGERHVVEVKEAKAWIDERNRLRIEIKAAVDGVEVEREFVLGRYNNRLLCQLKLWARAPGGREADKRRVETLSVVIFGDKPGTTSGGRNLKYTRRHLEHAMRFREIKETAEKWLHSQGLKSPQEIT